MAMTDAGRRKLDEMRQAKPDPRQLKLPWGGRSPRALTRAANDPRFRLETSSIDEVGDRLIDEQCRRHFHGS